jgi:hypothetical protein
LLEPRVHGFLQIDDLHGFIIVASCRTMRISCPIKFVGH